MKTYDQWKTTPEPEYDPSLDDEPLDDEEQFWAEAEMNCHMRHDGQCGAAGSEYCDFDCPFRDKP